MRTVALAVETVRRAGAAGAGGQGAACRAAGALAGRAGAAAVRARWASPFLYTFFSMEQARLSHQLDFWGQRGGALSAGPAVLPVRSLL